MDDQIARIELITMISRAKRSAVSREVTNLCDAMEKYLLAKPATPVPVPASQLVQARFDKKAYQKVYMKTYMAKRRAEARRPKML